MRARTSSPFIHRAKRFRWNGRVWPSLMAFCRQYGLHPTTVCNRIARGVIDERLVSKRNLTNKGASL